MWPVHDLWLRFVRVWCGSAMCAGASKSGYARKEVVDLVGELEMGYFGCFGLLCP